jgi:hypothetical protein
MTTGIANRWPGMSLVCAPRKFPADGPKTANSRAGGVPAGHGALRSRPAGRDSFYRGSKVAGKSGSFRRYGLIGNSGRKIIEVGGLTEGA